MTIQELDHYFPFLVFFYGCLITGLSFFPVLLLKAKKHVPEHYLKQFQAHRLLGQICFFVGGLWSLQNLLV